MVEPEQPQDDGWPRGWEGDERAQLRWMADLPFRVKVQWLEGAQRFVLQLRKQRGDTEEPHES
jgi:hypothetical protein